MDYYVLLVFVAGLLLGLKFGKRRNIPDADRLGTALAIILLFVTGLSLGSAWFSEALSGIIPASLMMACLTMLFSLIMAELFWRRLR